jgi:hypothetical protein
MSRNPRIEHAVEDVGDKVERDDDQHHRENDSLYDRKIAVDRAVDDQASHTRDGEHRFDHHSRGEHPVGEKADHGQQVDTDVLQSMPPQDRRRR